MKFHAIFAAALTGLAALSSRLRNGRDAAPDKHEADVSRA